MFIIFQSANFSRLGVGKFQFSFKPCDIAAAIAVLFTTEETADDPFDLRLLES